MSTLWLELRQAFRSLRRSPGFTVPVVLVLALGIGANVALHAILQAVLFRPLPLPRLDRLAKARVVSKGSGEAGERLSHPRFEALKAASPLFQQMAASLPERVQLLEAGQGSYRTAGFVDPDWFATLGIRPQLGRFFSLDEAKRGEPLAVLGEALWREVYHRDPGVVGRSLSLNGRSVQVVGVAPPFFEGLDIEAAQELWMPMASRPALMPPEEGVEAMAFLDDPEMYRFDVVGRLRDGGTFAQAQLALDGAGRAGIFTPRETADLGFHLRLEDLRRDRERLLDEYLPQRPLLFGATSLALLLAIVGAGGLIAARAEKRRRDLMPLS